MIEVTAAIIQQENKVLLAQRKYGKHLGGYWELPGGKIEEGEDDIACLERELKEEFSITVKVRAHFMDTKFQYDHLFIQLKAYYVEHLSGTYQPMDHFAIAWVPIDLLHTYKLAPADIPIIKKLQAVYGIK